MNSKLQKNLELLTGNSGEHHLEVLFEWLIKVEGAFDAPLMEVLEHSTFKILQAESVYVLLIRYPRITHKCMLYRIKPIEGPNGKLYLEDFAAFCNGKYQTVRNCKKYISSNICMSYEHACTQRLLNGMTTNCTVIS